MKRIIIFSFITCLHLNVKPQEPFRKVLDSTIYHWMDGEIGWRKGEKVTHDYDIHGNEIGLVHYHWINDLMCWMGTNIFRGRHAVFPGREEKQYDEEGNMILRISFFWDVDKRSWYRFLKEEFTYDGSDRITESRSFLWDTLLMDWGLPGEIYCSWGSCLGGNYKYTYDESGNLITWFRQGSAKYDAEFDSTGNKVGEGLSHWSDYLAMYFLYDQTFYTYDSLSNLVQKKKEYRDEENPDWINHRREEFFYDSTSKLTETTGYEWNSDLSVWANKRKYLYEYDSAGHKTDSVKLYWDEEGGNWINGRRTTRKFNDLGKETERVGFSGDGFDQWEYRYMVRSEYDDLGNLIFVTTYNWNSGWMET